MDTIDIFLYVGYILIIIGAVLAILMPLIKSLDDPKGLVKSGIAIVALGVLFFIAYTISDDEVLPRYALDPFNLTPGLSKFVGGSLITTYALVLIALAGIVLTEINKAVR